MVLVIFTKAKRVAIGAKSKSGKYVKVAEGRWVPVKHRRELPARIQNKFKVPPAWKNLQYFNDPKSKLWVKGEDAKGRVQYIYNPAHVDAASKEKFARIKSLNKVFEEISREVAADVKGKNEAATVLWLIMSTGIRPGSEKNTRGSVDAFGATTLEGRHVMRTESGVSLKFIGKKGVDLEIPVKDADVAKMLLKRKSKAGKNRRLFGVTGDGLLRYTHRLDNNAGFQSKDFRTHLGTEVAMKAMRGKTPATMAEYKKRVKAVGDAVAHQLGNTRAVALGSYVNPAIFEKWRRKIERP
jgi:DNA topoisomerase-1